MNALCDFCGYVHDRAQRYADPKGRIGAILILDVYQDEKGEATQIPIRVLGTEDRVSAIEKLFSKAALVQIKARPTMNGTQLVKGITVPRIIFDLQEFEVLDWAMPDRASMSVDEFVETYSPEAKARRAALREMKKKGGQ